MTSRITLPVADLPALLALPTADPPRTPLSTPGVVVLHAWWGADATIAEVCRRFAALGYAVLAPDLYRGRTTTGEREAMALRDEVGRGRVLAALDHALSYLQHETTVRVGRIGLLGFSLGGSMALRLAAARHRELAGVVTFYGLAPELGAGSLPLPVLAHFAATDEHVAAADVAALRASVTGGRGMLESFEYAATRHGFFEHPDPTHRNAEAARRAWDRSLAFLDLHTTSAS